MELRGYLVSFAIMIYQITLTRLLSVVVWFHFAFLTISLVMLGLGAPDVWFALDTSIVYIVFLVLPATLSMGGVL